MSQVGARSGVVALASPARLTWAAALTGIAVALACGDAPTRAGPTPATPPALGTRCA